MFGLVQFYVIFREHVQDRSPGKKFIAVKMVVFLSFWQSIVLSLLQFFGVIRPITVWSLRDIKGGLQNLLLIVEMLFAAIFHIWAFPYTEYAGSKRPLTIWGSICDVINPADIIVYSIRSFMKTKKKNVLEKKAEADESWVDLSQNSQQYTTSTPLIANYVGGVERGYGDM